MTESGMEEIEVYQAISLSFQEVELSMAKGKDVRSLTCWVTDASQDQTSKKKNQTSVTSQRPLGTEWRIYL